MAIDFLKKRKTQKILILIFIGALLVSAFFIWRGFSEKEEPLLSEEPVKPLKKIEINYSVLENPILKELEPFEKIPPLEEKAGRENPFIPY